MDGGQAVILADITIDSLIEMVKSAGRDESVQTFLLAGDNSVITHENAEYLPKEEGNTILTDVLSIDLGREDVSSFQDYDGISKYYVVRQIESTGWRLGVMQATSVISDQIRNNLIVPLAVDLMLLLVFIVLLNITVRRMLEPLTAMKTFIREKVIGAKNCKVEKSEVKEISYLIEELENRVISTIHKTQQETGRIQEMISGTESPVSDMNGNIMEISAIMEETGANVTMQTTSISEIDENCQDVAKAMDVSQKELDGAVQSVNENLQIITNVSENVAAETKDVMQSITSLQATMEQFNL